MERRAALLAGMALLAQLTNATGITLRTHESVMVNRIQFELLRASGITALVRVSDATEKHVVVLHNKEAAIFETQISDTEKNVITFYVASVLRGKIRVEVEENVESDQFEEQYEERRQI